MIRATIAHTSRSVPITQTAVRAPLPAFAQAHGVEDGPVLLVHQPLVVGLRARLGQVLRVLRLPGLRSFASHGREASGADAAVTRPGPDAM